MRRGGPIAIALIGALSAAPIHAARENRVALEPTSDWVLDLAEERCSLTRDFGQEKQSVRLRIDSYGSRTAFQFVLAGPLVPNSSKPSGEIRFGFSADTIERKSVMARQGRAGKLATASFDGDFMPYDPAIADAHAALSLEEQMAVAAEPETSRPDFEKLADRMTIDFGYPLHLELHLGRIDEPLRALRTCVGDLHRKWGLDPAKQQTLSRRAVPDLSSIKRVLRTYPMVVQSGRMFVRIRIMVDAQGDASQCVVQAANVQKTLRRAVCDGLARSFAPALDEAGAPVASIYQTSVHYMSGS